jgi:peptide/histidine transporter 3/4
MQGLIMGLFYFMSGIGSFLGTAIMYIFQGIWFFTWDHGDINCRFKCRTGVDKICAECHMDYYFFVLAGVQVFGLLMYLILTWKFGLGKDQPGQRQFNPESSINRATRPTPPVSILKKGDRSSADKSPIKGYDMNYTA